MTADPFLRIHVTLCDELPATHPSLDPLDPCDLCGELVPRSLLSCSPEGEALCEACDAEETAAYTSTYAG